MEINKQNWIEFDFKDIFWFKRGKRLITQNQIDGDIAYISSTKINNGIDNYITPPDYMTIYENAMTLNNSGSIGYCFYHTYKFVASDHCTILKIKDKNIELNLHLFLFFKPIIEKMKAKYGFAREMSNERLNKEKILLPAKKKKNKYIPDWEYMVKYIKEHSKNITYNKKIQKPKKTIDLNSVKWKEYVVKDVFKIKRGKRLKSEDRIKGNISYYSASDYNNGLTDFISNSLFIEKDALIYSTFGQCFFVEGKFTASDEISILKHKELNKFNGLFIASILRKNKHKYTFGRKAFYNKFSKDTILLPVNKRNEIYWEFMEDYIKSLPYSVEIEKDE